MGGSGASPCEAGLAFCDDFESYAAGSPPMGKWQAEGKASNGFSMAIDTMHAFSGTKAFHVSVDYSGNAYAEIYHGAKTGIAGATAYARFMMYQTKWDRPHPNEVPGIHARIFFVGNASVDLDFSPTVFVMEADRGVFGPDSHGGPKPILNKWICIEAQFGPMFSLTVDGIKVSSPPGGGKGLDSLKLGISTYRKFATDFWIDDLVVDTKPLPCPKK